MLRFQITVSVSLLASVPVLERDARACGGLFCGPAQPVVQTGEGIIFAVDDVAETVDAVINIQYQGDADEFAWVLPLQSAPVSLEVAPAFVFSTMDAVTAPQFSTQWTTRGQCQVPTFSGSAPDVGSASDAGAAPGGGGVQVLSQKPVGPYHSAVIQGSDPEELRTWLVDNGYRVTDEMMRTVVPYVAKGDALLALKLRSDRAVGDIQPIWVTMAGDEVCVPIRLTAIAAIEDMGITTLVLSNRGRAIPENYNHLQLNWARLDWVNGGSNYRALVAEAADQGGGNAFVTEYAGSSAAFDRRLYQDGRYDRATAEAATDVAGLVRVLQSQGLTAHPEVAAILTASIGVDRFAAAGVTVGQFSSCPGCWAFRFEGVPIDARAIVAQIWLRVVAPLAAAQALFDRFSYATRLYTLLSPDEMNVDPEFSFRADLPDVSNAHFATITRDCTGGPEFSDAPLEVFVQTTGQTIFLGPTGTGTERTELDQLPAAVVVEQLAQGLTLEDHRRAVDEALIEQEETMRPYVPPGQRLADERSCDCRATRLDASGLWLSALLVGWLGLRRRSGLGRRR